MGSEYASKTELHRTCYCFTREYVDYSESFIRADVKIVIFLFVPLAIQYRNSGMAPPPPMQPMYPMGGPPMMMQGGAPMMQPQPMYYPPPQQGYYQYQAGAPPPQGL